MLANRYNEEANNIMTNHVARNMVVEWNRKLDGKPFAGDEAHSVGYLLEKLKFKNAYDLCVSNYVRELSKVYSYGWIVEESRVGEAAIMLVDLFNNACANNLVRAVLEPLTCIQLANGKHAVVSYFAVDQANESLVQSMYSHCEFKEGDSPPEFI